MEMLLRGHRSAIMGGQEEELVFGKGVTWPTVVTKEDLGILQQFCRQVPSRSPKTLHKSPWLLSACNPENNLTVKSQGHNLEP